MEQHGMTQVGVNRCEKLRSKGMYIDTVWDPTVQRGEEAFWCQHTFKCLGPDGKPVDEVECNPSRECFVEL